LNEQCEFNDDDTVQDIESRTPVSLKAPKDIPSNSLQNPSDEDAGYSGHKGQGFQVQLTETCTIPEKLIEPDQEEVGIPGDESFKHDETDTIPEKQINLISGVITEGAHEHDSQALVPMIEKTEENELEPKLLLADTAYGSDENVQEALNNHDIEVISPASGKDPEGEVKLSDFHTDESGTIKICPMNQEATATKTMKNGNVKVGFKAKICGACPNKDNCPVTIKGGVAILEYSNKQYRLSKRRAYEKTEEFKRRYRMRSRIEATNSTLA
jgi:MinD superfamily P-loop ATPase